MTERVCRQCQEVVVPDQPDPCFGMLPGVDFACCGHGDGEGYVIFANGTHIRFPACQTRPVAGLSYVVRPFLTFDQGAVVSDVSLREDDGVIRVEKHGPEPTMRNVGVHDGKTLPWTTLEAATR